MSIRWFGDTNTDFFQDTYYTHKPAEKTKQPILTLSKDQFAQHTTTKVEQLNIYSSIFVEAVTSNGDRKIVHLANMPSFSDQSTFKVYLENVYWILNQFSAIDEYKLTPNVDGMGGGQGSGQKAGNNGPSSTKSIQTATPMQNSRSLQLENAIRQAGSIDNALKKATEECNVNLVRELLKAGASKDLYVKYMFSRPEMVHILCSVSRRGDLMKVFLDAGVNPNQRFFVKDQWDESLLEHICRDSHCAAKVEMLIKAGATVTLNCLHLATSVGSDVKTVALLLDSGLSLDAVLNSSNATPLSNACGSSQADSVAIAKLLVKRGATISDMALTLAAQTGKDEIVQQFVVDKGFKPTSPSLIACFSHTYKARVCELLAHVGIDGNMVEGNSEGRYKGLTLLATFCYENNTENRWNADSKYILTVLLKNGADPKLIRSDIYTAMPKEIQKLMEEHLKNDPGSATIADTLVNKTLGSLSNSIYNQVEGANKIEDLRKIVKEAILASSVIVFLSEEKTDEVILLRKSFITFLAKELENVLGKKIYFNPENGLFNTEEIKVWVQDALSVWKSSNQLSHLQKRTEQQEKTAQKSLVSEQIELQKEAMKQQEKIAEELSAQSEKETKQLNEVNKKLEYLKEHGITAHIYN